MLEVGVKVEENLEIFIYARTKKQIRLFSLQIMNGLLPLLPSVTRMGIARECNGALAHCCGLTLSISSSVQTCLTAAISLFTCAQSIRTCYAPLTSSSHSGSCQRHKRQWETTSNKQLCVQQFRAYQTISKGHHILLFRLVSSHHGCVVGSGLRMSVAMRCNLSLLAHSHVTYDCVSESSFTSGDHDFQLLG